MLPIAILVFFFLVIAFHDSVLRWWRGWLIGAILLALTYWTKGLK